MSKRRRPSRSAQGFRPRLRDDTTRMLEDAVGLDVLHGKGPGRRSVVDHAVRYWIRKGAPGLDTLSE